MANLLTLTEVASKENLDIDRNVLAVIADATGVETVDIGTARGFSPAAILAVKPYVDRFKARRGVTSETN